MHAVDWTQVLEHAIDSVPAILAAIFAYLVHRQARGIRGELATPSGDPIGHVAERTHDLAAVNAAAIAGVQTTIDGGQHEQGERPHG